MLKIEFCYSNGDLARALQQAAEFIQKIGEQNVHLVNARLDDEVKGAWWVDVFYTDNTRK